ncbi:MAG: hypothetical protein ACR2P0_03235 [Acidimicrobiales bacterium]
MNTVTIVRHPIRGLLYGVLFGLGLMLIAVGQGFAALGTWPPLLILVGGIAVGVLWSMYGPAKGPKASMETGSSNGERDHGDDGIVMTPP